MISIEELKNPSLYHKDVKKVEVLQTHISYVSLTGDFAYKIKKPVDFGFLDFSTLDKRKNFCEQELKLNKRLCPEIYLDVVEIKKQGDKLRINGDGETVEYAVKMKQFSQENIMSNLLEKNQINETHIKKICDVLVDFYKKEKTSEEIEQYGKASLIKQNTDENFQQTENKINVTIPSETYNFIKKATSLFLEQKKDIFEKRIKDGFILDCHGDLHSGNIVLLDEKICIFDCIEFNKRFRFSDVASDISFLAMDLDYQGYPYLSSSLIEKYVEKSKDTKIFEVLDFYKCYRAYVRGKVTGFQLDDPNVEQNKKEELKKIANKYFQLAEYYASLFKRQIEQKKPVLFITSGLTGTGKTTISKKISVDYNASRINTDEVRKEIFNINRYERHYDDYNTGLYTPKNMKKVYEKIFEKTKNLLKEQKNVVIDATFRTSDLREKVREIADKTNSKLVILNTVCSKDVAKKYLDQRTQKKTVSDGRWEIYKKQKDSFEPFKENTTVVEVDISKKDFEYQLNVFQKILNETN